VEQPSPAATHDIAHPSRRGHDIRLPTPTVPLRLTPDGHVAYAGARRPPRLAARPPSTSASPPTAPGRHGQSTTSSSSTPASHPGPTRAVQRMSRRLRPRRHPPPSQGRPAARSRHPCRSASDRGRRCRTHAAARPTANADRRTPATQSNTRATGVDAQAKLLAEDSRDLTARYSSTTASSTIESDRTDEGDPARSLFKAATRQANSGAIRDQEEAAQLGRARRRSWPRRGPVRAHGCHIYLAVNERESNCSMATASVGHRLGSALDFTRRVGYLTRAAWLLMVSRQHCSPRQRRTPSAESRAILATAAIRDRGGKTCRRSAITLNQP